MTEPSSHSRLETLVEAAIDVFIAARGYRRTQMDDIARAAGVSKGTLYLYVQSKAALFDLCVRFADGGERVERTELPVPSPGPGATLAYIQERLTNEPALEQLAELLGDAVSDTPQADLESIVRMLYRTLDRHRQAIKLIDVASHDHPELSGVWFSGARGALLALIEPYIERGIARGVFLPVGDSKVAARNVLETCVLWAVHRHWDPSPHAYDETAVEDTVVALLVRGLVRHDAW